MPAPGRTPYDPGELRLRRDRARHERRRRGRRRLAALVGLIVIAVVAVVVITSSGSDSTASRAKTTTATIAGYTAPAITLRVHHRRSDAKPANEQALENAAISKASLANDYVVRGSPRHKLVALTFDDGPGPTTRRILHWLTAHQVPATFFLIGRNATADPAAVRAEVRAGAAIGDHTQSHVPLQSLSSGAQSAEILGGRTAITAITGKRVRLFRPPTGSFDSTTVQLLRSAGLLMVLWTVDTKDYATPGTDKIVYTALSGARAGTIVLMHDGGGDRSQTLAALPRIVKRLRAVGYRLVTVPQLLVSDPVPADQPPPHSLAGG